MTLARSLVWVASFSALTACGGGESPPAQSPDTAAAEPAAEPAPAADEAAAPAAPAAGDEGWEGEGSASAKPASGEAASPAPDAKGEETRTVEVISKLVKDQRQPVRDCYDKARKDIPALQGDMVIHFVLDPEGKIKKIELNVERSTLKSPPVVDCAIKVIRGIKFPASSRGMDTTINYPYNLNPR
jgi:hypothetical protein